ncbi:hypothetical protein BDZ97DRAFT_1914679 [Flammula alnicola]|nr:hypothetical protein BDZ97DRAFT_1914679 [Flammula alnicola]
MAYARPCCAYAQLAAATCTVYDHITTFDLEIELIWRRPKWSMVQFLFLIVSVAAGGLPSLF